MKVEYLESGESPTAEQLQRESVFDSETQKVAAEIIAEVRQRGDEALREYTQKYDGVSLSAFLVSDMEVEKAVRKVSAPVMDALKAAAASITSFHQRQLTQSWFTTRLDGA
ncbi:MAG: histidinol dehydrogenase, partial [Coriobacteriales bacterium]|nr:histidinol dehydrogenase [Coriobacteriales bacterium]